MKKAVKNTLALILCAVTLFGAVPLSDFLSIGFPYFGISFLAEAEMTPTGSCGEGLTWSFDDISGTLTISGSGDMRNFQPDETPWHYLADSIKTVSIHYGVTSIGNEAFACLKNLEKASIPFGVKSIGVEAFFSCSSLKDVTIPSSVDSINNYAFQHCTNLADVSLSSGIKAIGTDAFAGCKALSSIVIPDSVTEIGSGSFRDCTTLKTATICINLPFSGGGSAFSLNSESETASHSITTAIGDKAFSCCYLLESVDIGEQVTSLGKSAFAGCQKLTEIKMNGVSSIGDNAFENCAALKSIKIPDSVKKMGQSVFQSCTNLEYCEVGDKLSEIAAYTFANCVKLGTVKLPNTLTSINSSAFSGCSAPLTIYYSGTRSEWLKINIGDSNESLNTATIYCNYIECNTKIAAPSITAISYGDSLVLHTETDVALPAEYRIEWAASNGCFSFTADGEACTVTPKASGSTVFTAYICDSNGNIICSATQQLTSKAGFFDKLVAFFKELFGLTKFYPQALGFDIK